VDASPAVFKTVCRALLRRPGRVRLRSIPAKSDVNDTHDDIQNHKRFLSRGCLLGACWEQVYSRRPVPKPAIPRRNLARRHGSTDVSIGGRRGLGSALPRRQHLVGTLRERAGGSQRRIR
jgi:hypothetical protein